MRRFPAILKVCAATAFLAHCAQALGWSARYRIEASEQGWTQDGYQRMKDGLKSVIESSQSPEEKQTIQRTLDSFSRSEKEVTSEKTTQGILEILQGREGIEARLQWERRVLPDSQRPMSSVRSLAAIGQDYFMETIEPIPKSSGSKPQRTGVPAKTLVSKKSQKPELISSLIRIPLGDALLFALPAGSQTLAELRSTTLRRIISTPSGSFLAGGGKELTLDQQSQDRKPSWKLVASHWKTTVRNNVIPGRLTAKLVSASGEQIRSVTLSLLSLSADQGLTSTFIPPLLTVTDRRVSPIRLYMVRDGAIPSLDEVRSKPGVEEPRPSSRHQMSDSIGILIGLASVFLLVTAWSLWWFRLRSPRKT